MMHSPFMKNMNQKKKEPSIFGLISCIDDGTVNEVIPAFKVVDGRLGV